MGLGGLGAWGAIAQGRGRAVVSRLGPRGRAGAGGVGEGHMSKQGAGAMGLGGKQGQGRREWPF